jgi:hypothetical protein
MPDLPFLKLQLQFPGDLFILPDSVGAVGAILLG